MFRRLVGLLVLILGAYFVITVILPPAADAFNQLKHIADDISGGNLAEGINTHQLVNQHGGDIKLEQLVGIEDYGIDDGTAWVTTTDGNTYTAGRLGIDEDQIKELINADASPR